MPGEVKAGSWADAAALLAGMPGMEAAVASYSYGQLTVPVMADTSAMASDIPARRPRPGQQAASGIIGSSMTSGLRAVGGLGAAVGKSRWRPASATATVAATAFGVEAFKTAARAGEMDASLRALAKANNCQLRLDAAGP